MPSLISKIAPGLIGLAIAAAVEAQAQAPIQDKPAYPAMAPLPQYRIASRAEEIALARSAAPAAIADAAEVRVLGPGGYETAAKGTNGFVCLVELSWANDLTDPEFWNPKVRSPICLNPASVRSVLPVYLQRTGWALAGLSKAEMIARTKAALAAFPTPEPGAMAYMMSKHAYLSDAIGGHGGPHLMIFLPRTAAAAWGAGVPHGAVMGGPSEIEPTTTFFIPVPRWSDGDAVAMRM
jgi:hypothetical protein